MIPGLIGPVPLISVSQVNFQLPCTGLKLDMELSSEPELMCEVFLTPETYTLYCYITPTCKMCNYKQNAKASIMQKKIRLKNHRTLFGQHSKSW